ncbi:MAG: hypothetical protein WCL00_06905 [Bacteroidota bacterium]
MSIDPQDNSLIEKYILGKLNETEKNTYEERLQTDREFARKTRLIQTFPEMMSQSAKKEYDLQKEKEAEPKKKERNSSLPKKSMIYGMVGIFILVILFFIVFMWKRQENTPVEASSLPKTESAKSSAVKQVVNPQPTTVVTTPHATALPETKPQEVKPAEIKPEIKTAVPLPNGSIQLLSPADGLAFTKNDEILFKWVQPVDSFTRLCVCSETSNTVVLWRGIRPGTREFRIAGKNFFAGNFYWYVGTTKVKRRFSVKQ